MATVANSNMGSTPSVGDTSVNMNVNVANASMAGGITSVILTSSGFTAVMSTIRRNEQVCSGVEGSVRFLLSSGLDRMVTVFATGLLNFAVLGPMRLL